MVPSRRPAQITYRDAGTQVIHSCYDKTTGALRVIDPSKSQTCTSSEAALNWNGQGLNWRGAWSATKSYSPSDVVTLGGGSYLAKTANLNSQPPNTNWAILGSPSYANVVSDSNETGDHFPLDVSANLTKVIETTSLPAGNYTVTASVTLAVDNDALDVQCFLSDNHGNFGSGYAETAVAPNSQSGVSLQTLTLTDAFSNEPLHTLLSVKCAKANGADPDVTQAVSGSISANAVGHLALNGQQFITGS